LTASAAAQAIARGWSKVRPQDSLDLLPITDGGDGFGEAMGGLLRANVISTRTVDAAHRPCMAKWWWEPRTKTAIIESASAIGLAMLPPKRFHPFELDTFGLGRLIQAALSRKATRCLIGIGGSATNDGGFGLARALGWEFIGSRRRPIEQWTELLNLQRIKAPKRGGCFERFAAQGFSTGGMLPATCRGSSQNGTWIGFRKGPGFRCLWWFGIRFGDFRWRKAGTRL
jgi:glycerate kinase